MSCARALCRTFDLYLQHLSKELWREVLSSAHQKLVSIFFAGTDPSRDENT